jgi:crossover junction endodeoxyribonuclease RuvC
VKRILAIDQSIAQSGYNIMTSSKELIAYGLIKTSSKTQNHKRLLSIYQRICDLITTFKPDVMVIEDSYFRKNVKTLKILNQVRGVVMLVAAQYDLELIDYTATQGKSVVTGNGGASKDDVRAEVLKMYAFDDINEDIADSIALSLTYISEVVNNENE